MTIVDLYSIANKCSMPKVIRDAFEELINQGIPFELHLDKDPWIDPWKDPLMKDNCLVFRLGHGKVVSLRSGSKSMSDMTGKQIEYYDFLKECLHVINDNGYVYDLKGILATVPITTLTTKVPTITDYIPTDIGITADMVAPTYSAAVEKFLDTVKTELESRGDFTVDVSKLVDLLFKLGVVISKGD